MQPQKSAQLRYDSPPFHSVLIAASAHNTLSSSCCCLYAPQAPCAQTYKFTLRYLHASVWQSGRTRKRWWWANNPFYTTIPLSVGVSACVCEAQGEEDLQRKEDETKQKRVVGGVSLGQETKSTVKNTHCFSMLVCTLFVLFPVAAGSR